MVGDRRHSEYTHSMQVLHLQGIRPEPPKPYLAANMSRYGMGSARSLADWQRFAGVDLQAHKVLKTSVSAMLIEWSASPSC